MNKSNDIRYLVDVVSYYRTYRKFKYDFIPVSDHSEF